MREGDENMKIAVIGLGKIGASVCADLKNLRVASEVTGVDTDARSVNYCLSKGLIDKGFENPARISPDTDISVLAVPVEFMEGVARELFAVVRAGAVVTDVGSVKGPVSDAVCRILPEGVFFVPAHPVAGDETRGARNCRTGIFKGNPVIITSVSSPPDGYEKAVGKIAGMWEKMGAKVLTMSPAGHDRLFAFVSHLPHVCAYSLASTAASADSETVDPFAVSGGGLKDTTRIALSDPELWAGILIQNSAPVLEAMKVFSQTFDETADAVKSGDKKRLAAILERGRAAKARHPQKT